jgi:hypothetical protein
MPDTRSVQGSIYLGNPAMRFTAPKRGPRNSRLDLTHAVQRLREVDSLVF